MFVINHSKRDKNMPGGNQEDDCRRLDMQRRAGDWISNDSTPEIRPPGQAQQYRGRENPFSTPDSKKIAGKNCIVPVYVSGGRI